MQTVLLSLDLSESCLQGLGHITTALDISEYRIEPYVLQRSVPEAVVPEIPKVLPYVHQLWAPLLAAFKVVSTPVFSIPKQTAAALGAYIMCC